MDEQKCGNCRFWRRCDVADIEISFGRTESLFGYCRRYPPVTPPDDGGDLGEFATTNERTWCGEWKPIAAALTNPIPNLVDKRTAAEYLGVTVNAVQKCVDDGLLFARIAGRPMFDLADIASFVESRKNRKAQ